MKVRLPTGIGGLATVRCPKCGNNRIRYEGYHKYRCIRCGHVTKR